MAYWYFRERIAEFRFSQLNLGVRLPRSIAQEEKKYISLERFNAD